MNRKIKWGILGLGRIAHQFAKGLKSIDDAELYAVVSRTQQKADDFAKEYDIPMSYGNYEDFMNNNEIEIVYIATPHPMHKEYSIMCMEAGKAVLCEKPVAMNQYELAQMIACSKKNDVFFMEAMWTRFLPSIVKVRELINNDVIGEIKRVTADFGFNAVNKTGRLYEPELGGGSLLDVGVYTISFSSMILGSKPKYIAGMPYIGATGVDERASIILGYENGVFANLFCGVSARMSNDAFIYGEKGYIHVLDFWHSNKLIVKMFDTEYEEIFNLPFKSTGYNYEAIEAMNCLVRGEKESIVMPLKESMDIMIVMDKLREQWGLKYPME